jgi:glycosyltransferase involved in cell wall biosynthesis
MPNSSLFVIITPSFNQDRFIAQTIESVLGQDALLAGTSLQFLVMDGDSTDETVKILRSYQKKISWVSKRDAGQTDAINKGIAKVQKLLATQKKDAPKNEIFFAYINSDDYYLSNAFATVRDTFAAHPEVQWLVGDCQIVNQKGEEIQFPIRLFKKIVRIIYQPWMLLILNPFPQPAVFIRWEAVQKTGMFNERLRYVMDFEYWLRLQKKFGKPLFLPQALAAFRIHAQSKGGTQFRKQFNEQFKVVQNFTQNPVLLFLHRVHNWGIKLIYGAIK